MNLTFTNLNYVTNDDKNNMVSVSSPEGVVDNLETQNLFLKNHASMLSPIINLFILKHQKDKLIAKNKILSLKIMSLSKMSMVRIQPKQIL